MGRTAEEYFTTVIFSYVIDRIIKSNPHEEVSSGDQEDAVMSFGDTISCLRIRLSITPGLTSQYINFIIFRIEESWDTLTRLDCEIHQRLRECSGNSSSYGGKRIVFVDKKLHNTVTETHVFDGTHVFSLTSVTSVRDCTHAR
jgi:hypothetical protein